MRTTRSQCLSPLARRHKANADADADADVDDDVYSDAEPSADPARDYLLVFGGRTRAAILDGKRFQFSTCEKTIMFRCAVAGTYSRANLPTPEQLFHLARELSVPLQPDELTEVCLKKMLDWIYNNVTPEKTRGLMIVHDKGYGDKKIKVSKALFDAVHDPAFSFTWIANESKMKPLLDATGRQWLKVNNRNRVGRTELLAESMSALASNPPPPTPSRPAVPLQPLPPPPFPAPLVYATPAPIQCAKSPLPTPFHMHDGSDSPSDDSDSDDDTNNRLPFSPVAVPYITPHTGSSRPLYSAGYVASHAAPLSPYTPTRTPRKGKKKSDLTLPTTPVDVDHPELLVKTEPEAMRSLLQYVPLQPTQNHTKKEKIAQQSRVTPYDTPTSSTGPADSIETEVERLYTSLNNGGLSYSREEARRMVVANRSQAYVGVGPITSGSQHSPAVRPQVYGVGGEAIVPNDATPASVAEHNSETSSESEVDEGDLAQLHSQMSMLALAFRKISDKKKHKQRASAAAS